MDATRIQDKLLNNKEELRFDIVLFNHPHLGSGTLLESEEKHATKHHVLLAHYFHSAEKVLKPNGAIHVCLCGNQPQTWDVMRAARNNGLHCRIEKSIIDCPIESWLFPDGVEYTISEVQSHYRAKRKFRNGKLGSKHFLSRYGYMHRRTEGELFRGTDREMNVQQSVNFVFVHDADTETSSLSGELSADAWKCSICRLTFSKEELLSEHLKNPALPDVQTHSVNKEVSQNIPVNKSEQAKEIQKKQSTFQPVDVDNARVLIEGTVSNEFESTRIKWLCRQSTFPLSKYIKSKKQCEDAIKQGRIFVNKQIALDTGRIVHENDTVSLIEKNECVENAADASSRVELSMGVKIIRNIVLEDDGIPSLVVAYKPVGIRCVGQFASDTLEMIVKTSFGHRFGLVNLNCQSISKVDTGCAGLCVLSLARATDNTIPSPTIIYSFTVLVHGSPNDSWQSGVYVTVPKNGSRNWKRQKTSNDSTDIRTSESKLDLSEALFIQCSDTYEIKDDQSADNAISTLVIQSSHDNGRIANTISFTCRKLGYPVVNDRFAKRESSSLPRRMKNLLKQKVCIGCYQVEICDEATKNHCVVSIEPHNRTQSNFWREQLDANAVESKADIRV